MQLALTFIVGISVLLFLVGKLKTSAFIGLIASAMVMGFISGMEPLAVVNTISEGFAATVLDIGLVIIFGTMLGLYLEASFSTSRMALDAIKLVGTKRSPFAMAITGGVVSIPVFSDAAFVLLAPLVRAIAKKSNFSRAVIGCALAGGLLASNVFVPPTPGPLAVAGLLDIDVGRVMIYGAIAALVMTLFGWAYAQFVLAKKPESYFQYDDDITFDDDEEDTLDETKLPSSFSAFAPLVLPLILIILNTVCNMILSEGSPILKFTSFIGNPTIALMIAVIVAIILLGKRLGKEKVIKLMNDSLAAAGPIIFIVCAGGALGAILKESGAGDSLANAIISTGLPFILVPYAIAAIIKLTNGSGTASLITSVTICAPLVSTLGLDPILLFLSAGAGASIMCHVNDSFFWVYTKTMGFDMATGLKTLSISNVIQSMGALLATYIISLFL